MENNTAKLQGLLLIKTQVELAQALKLSPAEVSRKINGETGFTVEQWGKVLDFISVKIVRDDAIMLSREKYKALLQFAADAIEQDMEQLD